MNDVAAGLLYLVLPLVLLGVGLLAGSMIEAAHFRRLAIREKALSRILLSDLKRLPENWRADAPVLVVGESVIATDYFKAFAAGLRNLFGGRVRSFETLIERARREAIVRMLQEAQRAGANVVWNVRIETATIRGGQESKSGAVEVMAYGTAMRVAS